MEYIKKGESVSIVVLGKLEPIYIHRRWMMERNIITGQEYEDSKNKPTILNDSISAFSIGNDKKVYCDRDRFQIECADPTAAQRIADICDEALKLYKPEQLKAIGINATLDFTFHSSEDSFRFGNNFVPLEQWKQLMPDPRVGSFSVQDNIENPSSVTPRRAINIASVGQDKRSRLPVVKISMNNHFIIDKLDEIGPVLSKVPERYDQFKEWCDHLFNVILA